MKPLTKKELMIKYNIKSVSGGNYETGFFDCLRAIENKNICLFKSTHIFKVINFAKDNKLPYSWLLCQLKNDFKKGIGGCFQIQDGKKP